jgi:hypothetical protein
VIKTMAQSLLGLWVIGDGMLNLFTLDLVPALQMSASMGALSLLTSIVSVPFADDDSPSLVRGDN